MVTLTKRLFSRRLSLAAATLAAFGTSAAEAQYGPGPVTPAGHRHAQAFNPSFAAPPPAMMPPQYGPPESYQEYCNGQPVVRRQTQRFDQALGERPPLFPHARGAEGLTFRLEWRQYGFSGIDSVAIGARQTPAVGEDGFYVPTSPAGQVGPFLTAESYEIDPFNEEDVNGIAGTFVIPVTRGTVEIDGFATEQASTSFFERTELQLVPLGTTTLATVGFEPVPVRPSIPLLSGGDPSATAGLPLDTLSVTKTHEFFGAGMQWVLDPITPEVWLQTRPTVGARYLQFREDLNIRSTFVDEDDNPVITDIGLDPVPPSVFNTAIDSRAINHVFGPTVGLRFDVPGEHLSFGVEPRFGFGISRRVEDVEARDLPRLDPATTDLVNTEESNEDADLAPFFELNVYGRWHVRENFNLFVGYNLFALSRMSTAAGQVRYDSEAADTVIGLEQATDTVYIQGLQVGGEYVFGR